jgi:hypothetical protein
MKFKEWVDGALVPEGDILDGAEEAFNNSRYVEAFALLHALIDWWMTDLIQLRDEVKTSSKIYELHFKREYRFRSSANTLLEKGIIDKKQYGELLQFNKLRDKIIHRLVMYSYQPHARNKVTKDEVIEGFEKGKALAHLLRGKTSSVVCYKGDSNP